MTGDLFEHLPDVPGYTYWDFPRETTVAEIGQSMLGDCIERYYVGYVRPEGAADRPYDFDDLGVGLLQPAGACMDSAVLEDLVADIAATEGVQQQEIGGHTVFRDEVSIVAVIGDVVVVLASEDLAMFDEMAGFIVPFLQNQPA